MYEATPRKQREKKRKESPQATESDPVLFPMTVDLFSSCPVDSGLFTARPILGLPLGLPVAAGPLLGYGQDGQRPLKLDAHCLSACPDSAPTTVLCSLY